MKKLKCFLGKRKEELFGCHITAGAGARGMRPGRSGTFSPAEPKSFVHATETAFPPAAPRARRISARPENKHNIGGSHPRALSPRRWGKQKGRTLLEMLAVLAIIGVLSVTALVGFTYAMNKRDHLRCDVAWHKCPDD